MSKSTQRISGYGIVTLLVLILGSVLVLGYYRIASGVERSLGKPHPRLGVIQKIRHTITLYYENSLLALPNTMMKETKFEIAIAEPVSSVCSRLQLNGIVPDAELICSYLIYSGLDRQLQSGQFTIQPQTNTIQTAQRISNPKLKNILFTVYPGWRLEETAIAISLAGYSVAVEKIVDFFQFPSQELINILMLPAGFSLEGYLCPGNFAIKPETSLEELSIQLTNCHEEYRANPALFDALKRNGFSYHEMLTLASIIQRETLDTKEMPKISSVFLNRLKQNMMLQTDPTVQYALGVDPTTKSWWRSNLTYTDLEIISPYNTYRIIGLPPGPISTPSEEAIFAAANPEVTDYFYFRAKCDGSLTHNFSQTYEQHLSNACQE